MEDAFALLPPFTSFKDRPLRDYVEACLEAVQVRDNDGTIVSFEELNGESLYKNIDGNISSTRASKLFKSISRLLPQLHKDLHGVPKYKAVSQHQVCVCISCPLTMLIICLCRAALLLLPLLVEIQH